MAIILRTWRAFEQQADAGVVGAGVVADDGEVFGAAPVEGGDEIFRNAAESEAAHHDGRAVGDERCELPPRLGGLCSSP